MSDKNNYYQPYHNQNDFNAFQQQAMAANPPMGNSQQGNGGNFVFNPFGYANRANQSGAGAGRVQNSPTSQANLQQSNGTYQNNFQPTAGQPTYYQANNGAYYMNRNGAQSINGQNGMPSITNTTRPQDCVPFHNNNNYQQAPKTSAQTEQYNSYNPPTSYQQTASRNYQTNEPSWSPVTNGNGGFNNEMMQQAQNSNNTPQNSAAQYFLSDELMDKVQASPSKKALLELQIGFEQLLLEPTEFDTWANVIRDRLTGKDLSGNDLGLATAILIEMSTVLDQSQYNFSRLAKILSDSSKDYATTYLIPQISEFVQIDQYLSTQHLKNLTIFLSEVYVKIEINGLKSSILSNYIYEELLNLLKITPLNDAIITTVIQVLKLTGRHLENERGPASMDALFTEITTRSNEAGQSVSEQSKARLISLELLRSSEWGYTETQEATYLNGNVPNGGDLLTDEESAFLERNLEEFDNSPNESMLDDKIEEDYEKFLQATAIRAAEKALEKVSFDDDDENLLSPKQR